VKLVHLFDFIIKKPDYYFKLNLESFRHYTLELGITNLSIIRRYAV